MGSLVAIRASTVAKASRGWLPGVSTTTRVRSHPGNSCLPKAGINPARARDDFPEPDGPYMGKTRTVLRSLYSC
nr:hypothetical protein [Pseudanabaena sp. FACHB-2040]